MIKLLVALVLLNVSVITFTTNRYIEYMFDGWWSEESVVEGLYFSVQTVTTVGYGNWEPARLGAWRPAAQSANTTDRELRQFKVKYIAIPSMVLGVSLFGMMIAVLGELVRRFAP